MPQPSEKYNIVCLSNQLWDYPIWTNKKHVMSRMAKKDHNVLFVDPPINVGRVFLRHFLNKEWGIKRILTCKKDVEGVIIYSPLNVNPFKQGYLGIHINSINRVARRFFNPKRKTLLWIYNVEIKDLEKCLKNISYDILIYDCVDNYSAFPKYNTPEKKKEIIDREQFLAGKANVVFATAPGLVDKLKKYNPNTFYMPNVGDYERFKNVQSLKDRIPEELKAIPPPRIGFTGAIDEYKFDRELFRKVALDYPKFSFIIIGPIALKDREGSLKELGLSDLNNVYLLPTQPYEKMPYYLAGFDVMTIPYQINDYTVSGCFPVKFHEELAAGLPVVVTDLPAYAPFSDVCYISKSYNEFSQNIRRALEETSPEKVAARKKVAKENTWEGKVSNMLKIISGLI